MQSNGNVLTFLLEHENLSLVLLFDSLSLIVDYDYEFRFHFIKAYVNMNRPLKGILNCVLNYVHAHLLETVVVTNHKLWK